MRIASRLKDVLIPIYLALVSQHLGYYVQVCLFLSIVQKKCQQTEKSPATNIIREPQHLIYEESLKELRLFNLKIRQLRSDLIVIFHYLKVTEKTKSNLSVRCSEREATGCKLLHEKFQWDIWKLEQFV